MDMLVKKEKIFDNIVAVSGTKKEAIRTISRLCAKQTMLDATQLEKALQLHEEWKGKLRVEAKMKVDSREALDRKSVV